MKKREKFLGVHEASEQKGKQFNVLSSSRQEDSIQLDHCGVPRSSLTLATLETAARTESVKSLKFICIINT
jgi:hypothetical protein